MFRIIAILNTIPGSNISIKKVIGNIKYFLLSRSLFDDSGLPNHGREGISDFLHAVINCIDDVWIDLWRGKLDFAIVDGMRAILNRQKWTMLEIFKCFHVKKMFQETLMSSTEIISFDGCYENMLKVMTK